MTIIVHPDGLTDSPLLEKAEGNTNGSVLSKGNVLKKSIVNQPFKYFTAMTRLDVTNRPCASYRPVMKVRIMSTPNATSTITSKKKEKEGYSASWLKEILQGSTHTE